MYLLDTININSKSLLEYYKLNVEYNLWKYLNRRLIRIFYVLLNIAINSSMGCKQ